MAPVGSDRRSPGNWRLIRIRCEKRLDHTLSSSQRISGGLVRNTRRNALHGTRLERCVIRRKGFLASKGFFNHESRGPLRSADDLLQETHED